MSSNLRRYIILRKITYVAREVIFLRIVYSFFLFSFIFVVFTTRFPSLLFVNHRERHVQIANAYTGSATVHCKYTQKCACVQERRRGTHARHTHPLRAIPRASTNTTLGLCRRSSTPHDNPPPFSPTFTEQIPSTTRIPPGEPLNQYSPFSAGQEYHPSCPPPWTNFRHRPRRLSLRFVAVR